MIRMTFECPETGRPIGSLASEAWLAESPEVRMAMHCPKCSQLHEFTRDQSVLELSAFARPARALAPA